MLKVCEEMHPPILFPFRKKLPAFKVTHDTNSSHEVRVVKFTILRSMNFRDHFLEKVHFTQVNQQSTEVNVLLIEEIERKQRRLFVNCMSRHRRTLNEGFNLWEGPEQISDLLNVYFVSYLTLSNKTLKSMFTPV